MGSLARSPEVAGRNPAASVVTVPQRRDFHCAVETNFRVEDPPLQYHAQLRGSVAVRLAVEGVLDLLVELLAGRRGAVPVAEELLRNCEVHFGLGNKLVAESRVVQSVQGNFDGVDQVLQLRQAKVVG